MEKLTLAQERAWEILYNAIGKGRLHHAINATERLFKKHAYLEILKYREPALGHNLLKVACNQRKYGAVKCIIEKVEAIGGKDSVSTIINQHDNNKDYPIHCTARLKEARLAEILLKYGAFTHFLNKIGRTPLFIAVSEFNLKVVRLLLSYSADPNIKDPRNKTPLHCAIYLQSVQLTKALLEKKALTNCQDDVGQTPSSIALTHRNLEILSLLLIYPIDPSIPDEEARKVYSVVKQQNPMLRSLDTLECFLFISVMSGCLERVQHFIKKGASINAQNSAGQTPLHIAILEQQKTVSIEQDISITTQLEAIVEQERSAKIKQEIIKLFAKNPELDLDIKDARGYTSLQLAVYYNDHTVVQCLLSEGVSVDNLHTALQVGVYRDVQFSIINDIIGCVPKLRVCSELQKSIDSISSDFDYCIYYRV